MADINEIQTRILELLDVEIKYLLKNPSHTNTRSIVCVDATVEQFASALDWINVIRHFRSQDFTITTVETERRIDVTRIVRYCGISRPIDSPDLHDRLLGQRQRPRRTGW